MSSESRIQRRQHRALYSDPPNSSFQSLRSPRKFPMFLKKWESQRNSRCPIQLMLDAKKNLDRADQELRIAAARKEGTGHGTRGGSVTGTPSVREKRSVSVVTDGDAGEPKRHRKD